MRGDVQGDIGRVDQISKIPDEKTGSHPLKHSGGVEGTDISKDIRKRNIPESLDGYTDPTPVQGTGDEEPIGYSTHSDSPNEWGKPLITDGTEDTEDEDGTMVGVVGSAAPWFLTGWMNDVEVEFMIDTGCQVTILATSVFEKMYKVHPQVKDRLSPCTRRLVSADLSPLTVVGVLPPDSEVMASFSINGGHLGSCALIGPNRDLTEEFGVVVGHTLVDASTPSANVLIINPNTEEVVLPCGSRVGKLVPILSVSVAQSELCPLTNTAAVLPDYLEDIVKGSHTSLGDTGRQSLRYLLHRYKHVFPAPGEPVTGRSKSVQHDIVTKDSRPVRCGPHRLAPAGLRKEQDCVKDMLTGGQIEPSDSPWASPVVLVTKKDGSTRFCVDYRRLNSLTIKDAYPLPRIDDSLRLLGNQQWFSTMDLASGYWQVAMSPEAKRKAAFVTNEGLFQFRVMPFGLCNAPATFERLMDRVLCGMRWSRCFVYLDDVISFGKSVPEALMRLEEVLTRLSEFRLQLKAKKCTFMQT